MQAETDADELRALQRRAYGRDGILTDAETRRLRELEDARRSPVTPPAVETRVDSSPEQPSPAPADVPDDAGGHAVVDAPEPEAITEDRRSFSTVRRVLRRYRVGVSALAVMTVALGVGIGGALFATRADGIALSAAQQERRDALAAADFDSGSLLAVAQDEDALAWYATKDDGGVVCLILDIGDRSQSNCLPTGDIGRGLSVSFPVPIDDPEDDTRSLGGVSATMLVSTAGEPMVALQRWSMSSTPSSQFAGAERARAEELADEGFAFSLTIVGSFRTQPVWVGDRVSERGEVEKCLIIDAGDLTTCESPSDAWESGIDARIDGVGGAEVGSTVLEARFTRWQTPYLVIGEAPASPGAPQDTVRVEAPPGDPIVVEPPGRDSDG